MLGRWQGMGGSDGRRNRGPQHLPNLRTAPFTPHQKAALDARARAIISASPYIHPNLTLVNQPADADPFRWTSIPAQPYPQPGQSAVTVLSYTVPRSKIAVILKLSIIHVGGNPPDFSGNVIWRVKKNGGGLRGLNQLTAQVGTFAAPLSVRFIAVENDTLTITAEVPLGQPAMPVGVTTAASFDGFTYALSEATSPPLGNY